MALTAKQEALCQAILSGSSQADAYRAAYNAGNMKAETIAQKASRLMADPRIRARVDELRKPVIARVQYGLEQAMKEAEEAMTIARQKGNGGAMVAAATLRAKLNGLLIDRKEVRTGALDGLPDEALDKMIAQKAKELGLQLH